MSARRASPAPGRAGREPGLHPAGAVSAVAAVAVGSVLAFALPLAFGQARPAASLPSAPPLASASASSAAPLPLQAPRASQAVAPPAARPGLPAAVRAERDALLAARAHRDAAFAVIDKRGARLWLFEADGRLAASTPVLLGLARGDHTVPGIGERPLADILPHERTTPAGRFAAEYGHNHTGEAIYWLDYDAAVSLHRLRPSKPQERRPERLASPSPADNRISYGCVNVPAAFFDREIRSRFGVRGGLVAVLPEDVAPAIEPRAARARSAADDRDG